MEEVSLAKSEPQPYKGWWLNEARYYDRLLYKYGNNPYWSLRVWEALFLHYWEV